MKVPMGHIFTKTLLVLCVGTALQAPLPYFVAFAAPVHQQQPQNHVESYLKSLGIDHVERFNLTKQLWKRLNTVTSSTVADNSNTPWRSVELSEEARALAKVRYFSPYSAPVLGSVFRALTARKIANALITGPAGVGKTFLLDQLALLVSFEIYPDYLASEIGIVEASTDEPSTNEATPAVGLAPFTVVRETLFNSKPEFYLVNRELLRKNPAEKGDPHMSAAQRMAGVIEGLFTAATAEFHRKDKPGRRTVFIFEEAATLDPEIQELLKPLIDRTGLRNPNDRLALAEDPGYHVIAITTDDERRKLARGDSAIERRYRLIRIVEMSEEQGFQVIREMANADAAFSGLNVSDDALKYIVHMRKFFDNPPQAMPANIIKALDDLTSWAMNASNLKSGQTTLELPDVQAFLKDRLGLTGLWFVGENGEPPLEGLAQCVKDIVSGQDEVVDQIAAKIVSWARLGFSAEVPVFFLGGPSGSGKDTIFAAFNLCMFGHDGHDFQFDVAGQVGFGLSAILKGPPIGNHSDDELPHLAQALDQGFSSMIALNEAQDIESSQMEQLKKFTETGEIMPQGSDSRMRKVYFPMFIIGQWGEYLFNERDSERGTLTNRPLHNDAEIDRRYAELTQKEIDKVFKEGKRVYGEELISENDPRAGELGAVPHALLQRARMTGGAFILRTVPIKTYTRIVGLKAKKFKHDVMTSNQITLSITDNLAQFIADVSEHSGEGTRGLHSTMMDYTRRALSAAMSLGMPQYNVVVTLDHETSGLNEHKIVVDWRNAADTTPPASGPIRIDARELRSIKMTCKDQLTPKLYEYQAKNTPIMP